MNRCLIAASAVFVLAGSTLAQTSELFSWSYAQNDVRVFQGGSPVRAWGSQGTNEFVGVVTNEIRTVGASNGQAGRQYDLNGGLLGGSYTNPGVPNIYDATTDGIRYNYAVGYTGGSSFLYRFDRDWSNPAQMFQVQPNALGTAYDRTDNTIWIAAGGGPVRKYDLNGNIMASFNPGGNYYGLALDPADGLLYLSEDGGSPNFLVVNQSGQVQGQISKNGQTNVLGIEFAIPSPGAAALLGLGGLAAARRRRA